MKISRKHKITNAKEIAQLVKNLKHKVKAKAQHIGKYARRKGQYIQNEIFEEDTNQICRIWEREPGACGCVGG
jgi:hypothetical protein